LLVHMSDLMEWFEVRVHARTDLGSVSVAQKRV
jgi:hypothetical protein